ncbi:MAG: signal protein PDZ, partial [Acidobacteria bacterium]|nr:signal protein PDZ [Acidobacteriota bacterium]
MGAVLSVVRSGAAAADAGFVGGDVIVQFDGERVRGARQFARLVRET